MVSYEMMTMKPNDFKSLLLEKSLKNNNNNNNNNKSMNESLLHLSFAMNNNNNNNSNDGSTFSSSRSSLAGAAGYSCLAGLLKDNSESTTTTCRSSFSMNDTNNDVASVVVGPKYDGLRRLLLEDLESDFPSDVANALMDIDDILLGDQEGGTGGTTGGSAYGAIRAACALDAPSRIISCMKKWLQEEDVHDWAIWCLHRLASHSEDARTVIVAEDGIHSIWCSMNLFPNTPDIQRGAFLTLADTLGNPTTSTNLAAKTLSNRLVKDWEGVSWVVKIMKKWPDDAALQEASTRLLCCLSSVQEARVEMIKLGADERVEVALEKFDQNERLKATAEPFMKMILKTMVFHKPEPRHSHSTSTRTVATNKKPRSSSSSIPTTIPTIEGTSNNKNKGGDSSSIMTAEPEESTNEASLQYEEPTTTTATAVGPSCSVSVTPYLQVYNGRHLVAVDC